MSVFLAHHAQNTFRRCSVLTSPAPALLLPRSPFPSAAPHRTVPLSPDDAPPADTLATLTGRKDEEVALGVREIYVHYGSGMADSKLKIRAASEGTARNINTIAELAQMAAGQ